MKKSLIWKLEHNIRKKADICTRTTTEEIHLKGAFNKCLNAELTFKGNRALVHEDLEPELKEVIMTSLTLKCENNLRECTAITCAISRILIENIRTESASLDCMGVCLVLRLVFS